MMRDYESINEESAKAIKRALARNKLTNDWLIHRLDRDWGIQVNYAHISAVLNGKRAIGPRTQRMLWCAEQIIKEYEEFYKGRGG
jgi:hypothetical protein